jgi:hypothetical protein
LAPGRPKKLAISVTLKADVAAPDTQAINGAIQKVSFAGDVWITTSGIVPPEQGVILAAQESDRAAERRRESVDRLQAGDVALPVLLDILNDPGLAARSRPRGSPADHRGLNQRQREVMERAVANESVMAIQGPPGTGKTKVIVEIVRHLFLARRQNESLRVLISSTQNEAVRNAVTKLQAEGVFIHLHLSKTAEDRAREAGLLQRLSQPVEDLQQQLANKLRSDLDLSRIHECLSAQEQMSASLRVPFDTPQQVLEFLIHICGQWNETVIAGMLSSWVQAPLLRDQLQTALQAMDRSAAQVPSTDGLPGLLALLAMPGDEKDAEAAAKYLQDHSSALSTSLGAALVETLREESKAHRREIRDAETPAIQARWKRMRELVAAPQPNHASAQAQDNLSATLRNVQSWRASCLEELDELREGFSATRAGVIVEWQQALRNDPRIWQEIRERYSQVVGATAAMAAPTGAPSETEWYDYVVVDEAGRSDLFDLLIPMTLGRRVLLVGDQQQLPPFIEDTLLAAGTEPEVERLRKFQEQLTSQTLFRELYDRLPEENRIMLNVQYRMHPIIGDAISDAFYQGELSSGPEDRSSPSYQDWLCAKQPAWGLCDDHPLVWVESGSDDAPWTTTENERELHIVKELVRRALAAHPSGSPAIAEPFLGIITFYSAQERLLNEALAAMPESKNRVEIGTVDSFQGKEFPLIILSCCRHDPKQGRVGFLRLPNRLNVALSRAQRQLIIVGSTPTLLHAEPGRGSQPMKDFCAAAGANLFRAASV